MPTRLVALAGCRAPERLLTRPARQRLERLRATNANALRILEPFRPARERLEVGSEPLVHPIDGRVRDEALPVRQDRLEEGFAVGDVFVGEATGRPS